ncbi:HEAT repeat domain-containing protein [Streptomyces sp. NBC_00654]|uniref:HEAT repeat domain-containing protein n=1 Tax=Streptomyces sp. NBC_00654 TaxID=2975799 RepID=UPI002253A578|nr:HEAT repeat domain-containing protein [Streptomyces sp. NBC_00654]MCX4969417.1 HEAT repeat domain-containing protein [Streptomyces sp. NBC_00654]
MNERVHLVPKTPFNREEMERIAAGLDWTVHRVVERTKGEPDGVPFEIIWLSNDQESAIHWIEDHLLQVDYIAITGPSRLHTAETLSNIIEFHTPTSMVDLFSSTRDGDALMDAVRLLSIQCQEQFDHKLFSLLRWAVNDPTPIVRRVALVVASTIEWEQIEPLVQYVHDHDLDELVRFESGEVLKIIRDRAAHTGSGNRTGSEQ